MLTNNMYRICNIISSWLSLSKLSEETNTAQFYDVVSASHSIHSATLGCGTQCESVKIFMMQCALIVSVVARLTLYLIASPRTSPILIRISMQTPSTDLSFDSKECHRMVQRMSSWIKMTSHSMVSSSETNKADNIDHLRFDTLPSKVYLLHVLVVTRNEILVSGYVEWGFMPPILLLWAWPSRSGIHR